MSDLPAFDRPAPMEGHGVYNRSSRVQAAGLAPAVPLLEQAARTVPLAAAAQPVVIADHGSSEGRNSLVPLAVAISMLRERVGPERAISVVHTDTPDNDFTALFQTLAEACDHLANLGKYEDSPENHCCAKVVLNDNVPVDDYFSGCETPLIVGEFLIYKSD